MIKTVYLDMDGVVADLNAWYSARYGIIPREDPNYHINWAEAVHDGMFKKLPFLEDSRELVYRLMNSGVEIKMLSCATKANFDIVSEHKTEWLKEHGLSKFPATYTKSKADKGLHATADAVLIDDSPACFKAFVKGGGNGILHKTGAETIKQLEEMGVL